MCATTRSLSLLSRQLQVQPVSEGRARSDTRGGRIECSRRERNARRRRVDRRPDVGAHRVEAAHSVHQRELEDGGGEDRGEVAEALMSGVAQRLRNASQTWNLCQLLRIY